MDSCWTVFRRRSVDSVSSLSGRVPGTSAQGAGRGKLGLTVAEGLIASLRRDAQQWLGILPAAALVC